MLFMLLIAFQVLLSTIKLHMSAFLGHLQIITTFAPLVLLVSFFFNHMSITNLSLGQGFFCFLGYGETQKGYRCYDPVSHRLHVSRNVVFWEYRSFIKLSHFRVSLSSSSVLDLFLNEAHIPFVIVRDPPVVAPDPTVVAPDSLVDFSVQPPDILDPFPSSPFNEQVEDEQVEDELPNPELGSPAPAPPDDHA